MARIQRYELNQTCLCNRIKRGEGGGGEERERERWRREGSRGGGGIERDLKDVRENWW